MKNHLRIIFSALSLALFSITALPAHAATKACKEGVKAKIEGEIRETSDAGNRVFLLVDDYSWDCGRIYVVATKAQAKPCMDDGGFGKATGILTQKDKQNMSGHWTLTDENAGKGPRMTGTFSCTGRPADPANPRPKSKSK